MAIGAGSSVSLTRPSWPLVAFPLVAEETALVFSAPFAGEISFLVRLAAGLISRLLFSLDSGHAGC